jgi:hypothetical protein
VLPTNEFVSAYPAGAALFLGVTMIVAGISKATDVKSFAKTIENLVPTLTTRNGRTARLASTIVPTGVIGLELLIGSLLLVGSATLARLVAALTVGICLAFVYAVVTAARKSVPCGCFGRLNHATAGHAEVVRTSFIALVAVSLTATLGSDAQPAIHASLAGIAIAALLALITGATTKVASLGSRNNTPRDPGAESRVRRAFRRRGAFGAGIRSTTATRHLEVVPATGPARTAVLRAAEQDGGYRVLRGETAANLLGLTGQDALVGRATIDRGEDGHGSVVVVAVRGVAGRWLAWSPDLLSDPISLELSLPSKSDGTGWRRTRRSPAIAGGYAGGREEAPVAGLLDDVFKSLLQAAPMPLSDAREGEDLARAGLSTRSFIQAPM